jgi:hypothetical protein
MRHREHFARISRASRQHDRRRQQRQHHGADDRSRTSSRHVEHTIVTATRGKRQREGGLFRSPKAANLTSA